MADNKDIKIKGVEDEDKVLKIDTGSEILAQPTTTADKVQFDPNFPNILKLDKDTENAIELQLQEELKKTIEDSASLLTELKQHEMEYAGIPDPINNNDPYPGASNTRSPWAAISTKGKCVRWISSMFSVEPWCLVDMGKEGRSISNNLEEWFQFMLTKVMRDEEEYSALREYRDIFLSTAKLNTGIAMIHWDRKQRPVFENNVTFSDINSFQSVFPTAKEAGIKEQEYQDLITRLQAGPITLAKIKKFKTVYNAPKLENVNRDKFITIPFDIKRLGLARGYGYEFEIKWSDLKQGEAEGRYVNIDRVRKASSSTDTPSDISAEIDKQENKETEPETEPTKKIYKAYKLIYYYDADKDGVPEKLILTYLHAENVLIKAETWGENLYFIPHYCETRPGRFDGIGVCKKMENLNKQGDTVWNLRNNAARMVCSPSFKALDNSDFDPTAQEWYPGVVFWVKSMGDVEAFQLMNNFPELFNEESLLMKYAELLSGYTSGHGGRELPGDANAPGNKTMALIQEGSILINDDINCLRNSVEQVFYCLFKMCAKYLDDDDKYLKRFNLTREQLNIALDQISLHGISVSSNKDARKMEATMFYDKFRQEPLLNQVPQTARDMVETVFQAWGNDYAALVPTEEEIGQIAAKNQAMAMQAKEQADQAKMALTVLKNNPPPPPPKPEDFQEGAPEGGVA